MLAHKSVCILVQQCLRAVRAFSNIPFRYDIIGIDLGATYSRLAVMEAQAPTILESESGRATPSFVAVDNKKNKLVGETAKYHAMAYPADVLFNMKTLIGRRYDDPEVQKLMERVPYKIIRGSKEEALVEACNEQFSPTQVYALLLGKMKKVAETCLVQSGSKAVIAAPVCFSDAQKKEIESAGKVAGLDVLGIVDEPIAGALSCKNINNGVIAVFNLGGSTFDVSILKISNGVIKVKARNGDVFLGGQDFDHVLVEYLVEEIRRIYSVDISGDKVAMMRLKEAAEKAKVKLSSSLHAVIDVRYLTVCGLRLIHANITISRSKFEEIVECLIERTRTHCKNCLKDASISVEEIDEVILIGGMSRVPRVQHIVREIFKKSPSIGVNPDEAVAVGAALQGALIIEDQRKLLPGRIPLSLGIETEAGNFVRIINRNSMIPIKASRNISTFYENQGHVCIRILQGEHEIASGNKLLGELMLTGIPPAPQGMPRIELTFDVDIDGILTVSARDNDRGEEVAIKVHSLGNTSEDYVKMMVKGAILCGQSNVEKSILSQIRSLAKIKINRIKNILNMKREVVSEKLLVETLRVLTDFEKAIDSENVSLVKSKIDATRTAEYDLLACERDDESDISDWDDISDES